MTPEVIGAAGFVVLLVVLLVGIPIGAALGLVGMVGLALIIAPEAALIKAGVVSFDTLSRYELGVLPLFMLMAQLCFAAGASRDFFEMAARFFGHKPGGLAIASIGGCAGFGAISGSSLATVATISAVALPEMRRQGYKPGFATGALAAGGTLGSLTPPSGALIVYGIIAEQSIGKLFAAAIVPVLTQALFYVAAIVVLCRLDPTRGPAGPRSSWAERRAALVRIFDIAALIFFVVGGLVIGWFTPTEAASVGCVGALAVCALRGKLTWAAVSGALAETLRTTGMIYVIVIGAIYLSDALIAYYARGDEGGITGYSARALARVWKAERFSWSLTRLMHRFPEDGPFERRMQRAELDYIAGSVAARTAIAENYVGLPL